MFAGGGGPSSRKPLVQQFEVGDFIRLHQDPLGSGRLLEPPNWYASSWTEPLRIP
jgi:hypothetical protein